MTTYGYVCVSSADQNETRQIDAMIQAGIDRGNLFIDKKSGATFDRPAWKRLRRKLKGKDIIQTCILLEAKKRN